MHVSRKTFDRFVEAAIAALPEDYAQWLDEVPIIVEDRPGAADLQGIQDAQEADPLGLYDKTYRQVLSEQQTTDSAQRIAHNS